MYTSVKRFIYLTAIVFIIFSCKTPIEPDFSFSPEIPRIGEKVTFTNLTEEGESWDWTYGDGGKSTLKNPTYIYKNPGVYDVTLMVDSNKHYVKVKQITVYDSIPTIYIVEDTVKYFQTATFKVIAYNPYSRTVTYNWSFSANAHGDDLVGGKSTSSTVSVYFSEKSVEETVNLVVTIGDSIYPVSKKFMVEDVPVRSMLLAEKDGKILRKRIFDNGEEDVFATGIPSGKHPFYIQTLSNSLYIFDAGSNVGSIKSEIADKPGDGNIRKVNLSDESEIEIVHNRNENAEHGFYSGFVTNADIYWTDFSEFVYKTPNNNAVLGAFEWKGDSDLQTSVPYYLAKVDRLGYFGNGMGNNQLSSGIYVYDNVYYWSKGGSGKGVYRFWQSDILSQNVDGGETSPEAGSIFNEYSIRAFKIDHVNQKIYFSVTAPEESVGLWVSSLNGKDAQRIDNSPMTKAIDYIPGITIDYVTDRVYWSYIAPETLGDSYFEINPTHRTGVKTVQLSKRSYVDTKIEYFAVGVEVYGIAIDDVKR